MTATLSNPVDISFLPARVQALCALHGQFASLRIVRELKVRKGKEAIIKDSNLICRIGVDYDNITQVQVKRDNNLLPKENAGLPWGQWLIFPYVIEHKGQYYVRCTQNNGNKCSIPKTTYRQNGVEITKEEAKADALASEFADRSDRDVFNVTVGNILEVNGKPL